MIWAGTCQMREKEKQSRRLMTLLSKDADLLVHQDPQPKVSATYLRAGLYSALSAAPPPALTSMTRAPATFPTSDSGHSGRSREQMGKTKGHSKFLAPECFSVQVNASPLKDK